MGDELPREPVFATGEDESRPFVNTETVEVSWPDGSEIQLNLTDPEREQHLRRQRSM